MPHLSFGYIPPFFLVHSVPCSMLSDNRHILIRERKPVIYGSQMLNIAHKVLSSHFGKQNIPVPLYNFSVVYIYIGKMFIRHGDPISVIHLNCFSLEKLQFRKCFPIISLHLIIADQSCPCAEYVLLVRCSLYKFPGIFYRFLKGWNILDIIIMVAFDMPCQTLCLGIPFFALPDGTGYLP